MSQLRPFDRFVFAMTVLERYTLQESAALLHCAPSDVEKARTSVLGLLAGTDSPRHAIAGAARMGFPVAINAEAGA